MRYEFEWDEQAIQDFVSLAKEACKRAVELLALDVWANIRKEAPTDKGRLAGSFNLEQIGDFAWRIYTNVLYALFVHEGTGVHGPIGQPIVPVRARYLAFEWQGKMWFLKSVKGQEPNPYADRAINMSEQRSQEFVRKALDEVGAA